MLKNKEKTMKKVLFTIASIALALVITGCGMSVMNPVSDPSVTITSADVAPTITPSKKWDDFSMEATK